MVNQILVSAGDAITARLVEEAGFDGIWVSGFEVSARMGLPDNGSLTMTEMLNVVKPIVEAVKIPVYVDVDTGYQNFQRTVREFERIGVEGVCVQDDLPHLKTNSLWGGKSPLMNKEEFGDKINVKKERIKIMARTEALIRGETIDMSISRALTYLDNKADIILIHSRDKAGEEARKIAPFFRSYSFEPLAIVPTKFPQYTNQQLFGLGYSMVIWANQTERVKIRAIRNALTILKNDGCAKSIENILCATLDDMKNLTPEE